MGPAGPGAAAFDDGVSVGFQSNDSRTVLFTTSKATEEQSYTGPVSPTLAAIESPGVTMGSKPAFVAFNGGLYAAFQANDPTDQLFVTSSTSSTGPSFPAATPSPGVVLGSAPALAVLDNNIFIAFQANDSSDQLFVTSSSSSTSLTLPAATPSPAVILGSAPAMSVLNNQLYLAFQADDPSHTLFVTSSSASAAATGQSWPAAHPVPNVKLGSAPALANFNGTLYIAFKADDTSNSVFIGSSSDGVNFTANPLPNQTMNWNSSPALVGANGLLYCIYVANDAENEMVVTSSSDGSTWSAPAVYSNILMSDQGPGAAATSNGSSSKPLNDLFVGFQAQDGTGDLFMDKLVNRF